jgi:hypothetical protein
MDIFNHEMTQPGNGSSRPMHDATGDRATPYRRSYVNDAVEVLRAAGRSMKLQELQSTIGHKRGKAVSLGSLKVCLSRYVDTGDSSKLLTRVAPGLFALREWHGRSTTDTLPRRQDHLEMFLWTAPADRQLGIEEQRVYILAENEGDVLTRLEFAGIPEVSRGVVEPCANQFRRQAASH